MGWASSGCLSWASIVFLDTVEWSSECWRVCRLSGALRRAGEVWPICNANAMWRVEDALHMSFDGYRFTVGRVISPALDALHQCMCEHFLWALGTKWSQRKAAVWPTMMAEEEFWKSLAGWLKMCVFKAIKLGRLTKLGFSESVAYGKIDCPEVTMNNCACKSSPLFRDLECKNPALTSPKTHESWIRKLASGKYLW